MEFATNPRQSKGKSGNKEASLLLALILAWTVNAQTAHYQPIDEQIPGPDCLKTTPVHLGPQKPCTPDDYKVWLNDVTHWRMETRIRMGYSSKEYERPELKWAQSSFIQPQMMIEDRYFYDPVAGKYTVDRYLDDLEARYGGIDSVLIWHTYPNLGIDDRNQYDLLNTMPEGIEGVRQMVADFHRRGVKVLFPIMLWDQGTHDPGMTDWEATAKLMAEISADGVNGDTLGGVPKSFRLTSDALGRPLVLEPEGMPPLEALAWNNMTWGYWQYPDAPMVSVLKWLEPRHMVNVCNRWSRSKTDELQNAFFNGSGYESWENIWGIWNQLSPRDAEALRRVAKLERAMADFLVSQEWQPFFPMEQYGVYSSQWSLKGKTLWTIVNRNPYDLDGIQIRLPLQEGWHYFDLWNGSELTPETDGREALLTFPIEAHGFAAILARREALDTQLKSLLSDLKRLSARPLSSYSAEWHFLPQKMIPIAKTTPRPGAPVGMVIIPAGDFVFKVSGIEIEGANVAGVDVQYPWEDSPRRHHLHKLHINSFWIDKYPVTNREFQEFLDATHYHPKDNKIFLHDWKDGVYPQGWGNKPVTWVSLEDARAYAAWAGKRLPHEWEWQYAAQGTDGRAYPWGNTWDESAVPTPDINRTMRGPDDVDKHAKGTSPFGVEDMVGNVWQWTDEFVDEHTRAEIVRGGSYYQPQGAVWYFPQTYQLDPYGNSILMHLDQHSKLLLMAPSIDRAGTVGFRCVKDMQ